MAVCSHDRINLNSMLYCVCRQMLVRWHPCCGVPRIVLNSRDKARLYTSIWGWMRVINPWIAIYTDSFAGFPGLTLRIPMMGGIPASPAARRMCCDHGTHVNYEICLSWSIALTRLVVFSPRDVTCQAAWDLVWLHLKDVVWEFLEANEDRWYWYSVIQIQ